MVPQRKELMIPSTLYCMLWDGLQLGALLECTGHILVNDEVVACNKQQALFTATVFVCVFYKPNEKYLRTISIQHF